MTLPEHTVVQLIHAVGEYPKGTTGTIVHVGKEIYLMEVSELPIRNPLLDPVIEVRDCDVQPLEEG